jgi:hypothetical protein
MAALDGAPGVALRGAVLGLFVRMPADGRGIEQDGRILQGRVPMVPWVVLNALNPRSPGVK